MFIYFDGVDDKLPDFLNLEKEIVDLDLHLFLTGGGKGRERKGRGWDGLRDVESVDLHLEVCSSISREGGREGGVG